MEGAAIYLHEKLHYLSRPQCFFHCCHPGLTDCLGVSPSSLTLAWQRYCTIKNRSNGLKLMQQVGHWFLSCIPSPPNTDDLIEQLNALLDTQLRRCLGKNSLWIWGTAIQCDVYFEPMTMKWNEVKWKSLSCVWLFATPWTIQSMQFPRPEYWSE